MRYRGVHENTIVSAELLTATGLSLIVQQVVIRFEPLNLSAEW
jgi:hypothetical protein